MADLCLNQEEKMLRCSLLWISYLLLDTLDNRNLEHIVKRWTYIDADKWDLEIM